MPSTLKLSQRETAFNNEVVTRFELYNSLFQTLPFYIKQFYFSKHMQSLHSYAYTYYQKTFHDI